MCPPGPLEEIACSCLLPLSTARYPKSKAKQNKQTNKIQTNKTKHKNNKNKTKLLYKSSQVLFYLLFVCFIVDEREYSFYKESVLCLKPIT